MPKKKKTLRKMTEEERLLFLEQERLEEEERRKNKETMLAQFLKTKLAKEEQATRFNNHKLNHQWRTIMRDAKSKELKRDLEILSQTFERIVDRKDSIIKSLGKDLTESEEQYAMALRSHLQNVDKLIDLQKQRIDQLAEFLSEQQVLIEEFGEERKLILKQHEREMTELENILFAMEENFNDRETEARMEFQSTRDEIKNKNVEEKQALRVLLEGVVEDLWAQFLAALKNYQEVTEERKKAFEELKAKDDKSAMEIELQMRKIQRLSDQIGQLKAKMSGNTKECEERNKRLREEREILLAHFQQLKEQMNKLHENERACLVRLTSLSNSALKELRRKERRAAQILKFAEMCRTLETEEEKVLPFYASSLTEDEKQDVDAAVAEEPSEPLAKVMYKYSALESFWKRYNKALLDKLALEKEKSVLAQENNQLRMLMKQYLDGLSVNDEILSEANPLFVVNQKTNVRLSVPVTDTRVRHQSIQNQPVVIEAAHMTKQLQAS